MYFSNFQGQPAKPRNVVRLKVKQKRSLLSRSLKLRAISKARIVTALRPLRVLIVDDDPMIGELLETILQALNYVPKFCSEPQTALSLIEREGFDVVLTDYRMPEMTGTDLAYQIRMSTAIPIILMTGLAKDELASIMKKADLSFVLEKPFNVASVVRVINEATRN